MGWTCQRCQKAHATLHITTIDYPSGEKIDRHLCERCAAEEGIQQIEKPLGTSEMLEQFVSSSRASKAQLQSLVCPECGMSYIAFRNEGLLGCPNDYEAFKEVMGPLLEHAHDDSSVHVGKSPRSVGRQRTSEQDLARLRRMLDEAIIAEDYERAAELRDRLRKAETG